MLFLLTILIILSAGVLLTVFVKRRNSRLLKENPARNFIPESFRPLFEPSAEELRSLEKAEKDKIEAEIKANKDEEIRRILVQKADKVREFREFWEMSPNRRNTLQLLYLAAQSESGKLYSDTAENVINVWKHSEIEDLTADHLAHILESHFWLLPNEERTSGVSFWLKQEIAGLRQKSLGKN